jgi:3-dehydroquinate synthase
MPLESADAVSSSLQVLKARQSDVQYDVHIGDGAVDALIPLASTYDNVALISCARILATPFGRRVASTLKRELPLILTHSLADRERGKTLAQLERAAEKLLAAGATRKTLIVALGGGTVTDAAGFLAATFMRGIDWVAVSTTLLGMVDAALGGKTAVNLRSAKNIVGSFHPPRAVLSDPKALATLPRRELRSGFGEVLKHALLRPTLLEEAAAAAKRGRAGTALVAHSALVKLEVVERDPNEKGERKLLNLGHTFGHGIEAAGRFSKYSHGESIAVGIVFAFRVARKLGRIGPESVEQVERILREAGLPVRVPAAIARRARDLMATDKKRTAGGLRWVLPRSAGATWAVDWDVTVDRDTLDAIVREIGDKRP